MKIERSPERETVVTLEPREVELLELALERASFIDTPPGRQPEILKFAEDLLRALKPANPRQSP